MVVGLTDWPDNLPWISEDVVEGVHGVLVNHQNALDRESEEGVE